MTWDEFVEKHGKPGELSLLVDLKGVFDLEFHKCGIVAVVQTKYGERTGYALAYHRTLEQMDNIIKNLTEGK
jgi:hypothetical protein